MRAKLKDFARNTVGTIAEKALPGLARDIDEGRATGKYLKLKRAIVFARITRAKARGDEAAVKKAINDWWHSDVGDHFYDEMAGEARLTEMFLGPHYRIVEELKAHCAALPALSQLIEVGCGDGLVLERLSQDLPMLAHFTGLDISKRIITRNQTRFSDNPRTGYEHANILEQLEDGGHDGTVLMSYGGVMEYLTQDELTTVYRRLASSKDVVVALAEPVDASFDVSTEHMSRFVGTEHVYYCHNYARILEDAGYKILYREDLSLGPWPWMMVLAVPE